MTAYFEKNGLTEHKDANTIPLGLATGLRDAEVEGGVLTVDVWLCLMLHICLQCTHAHDLAMTRNAKWDPDSFHGERT
jgi:hypothetical protein